MGRHLRQGFRVCGIRVPAKRPGEHEPVWRRVLYAGLFLPFGKIVRAKPKAIFDYGTICMVFVIMCARVNCLITGCCYGLYIPGTHFRWPTRQAEIVYYIILMVWIVRKLPEIYPMQDGKNGTHPMAEKNSRAHLIQGRNSGTYPVQGKSRGISEEGIIYPAYMMSYGIFRFICEFFRYDDSGLLFHLGHLWAALSFCIGISFYIQIKGNQDKEKNNGRNRRKKKNLTRKKS